MCHSMQCINTQPAESLVIYCTFFLPSLWDTYSVKLTEACTLQHQDETINYNWTVTVIIKCDERNMISSLYVLNRRDSSKGGERGVKIQLWTRKVSEMMKRSQVWWTDDDSTYHKFWPALPFFYVKVCDHLKAMMTTANVQFCSCIKKKKNPSWFYDFQQLTNQLSLRGGFSIENILYKPSLVQLSSNLTIWYNLHAQNSATSSDFRCKLRCLNPPPRCLRAPKSNSVLHRGLMLCVKSG